jgi:hypothetical protein
MKRWIAAFALLAVGGAAHANAETLLKPFILAWKDNGTIAADVAKAEAKVTAAGFQVVGSYSPYPTATIMIVTNDALKADAGMTKFGAYGAGQRIAVTKVGSEIQVSYTNPVYMGYAYRMKADMTPIATALKNALGDVEQFGPKDGLSPDDLGDYRYMFGMEEFDDPNTLATYKTYADAVAGVAKGLAQHRDGCSQVYRIDIPGKQETVFGVAMTAKNGGSEQADDAYIMKQIDFKPLKSTAHLPYEVVVSGNKVYALSARFRIAINFPDLSMMGSNSFMNIMGSPDAIRTDLSAVAGGSWTAVQGQGND